MAILLQALLLAGYAVVGLAAWLAQMPAVRRWVHLLMPGMLAVHLLHVVALMGEGIRTDLSATLPAFALAVAAMAWMQNLFLAVYGTYRFVLPLCFFAVLLPLLLGDRIVAVDEQGPAFWLHIVLASGAYALVLLAFFQLLAGDLQKNWIRSGIEDKRSPPLLAIERMALCNIYMGLLVLTLTLASGVYISLSSDSAALSLTHKNLFAVLTWVTLLAFVVGRRFRGWRGRTALGYMSFGMTMLLLSYFGTAFVLQVVLGR